MSYLLDTHIFLWWVLDNPKLDGKTRALMSETDASLFLSAASAWEMVIKSQVGKLILPEPIIDFIQKQLVLNDIESLDITTDHALKVFKLPLYHKDPFDRMLIAQSLVEDVTIITNDEMIKKYDVQVA